MLVRLLLCAAAILVSHAVAADPQNLGGGLPQPAGSDIAGPEVSGWDNVAFDELPGKAISATLQQAATTPEVPAMRGRKEIELYRNAASAVVLVLTKDGIGSGIHLGGGQIVTNWHVVGSFQVAAVLFKPEVEGAKINPNAVIRADVVKVDRLRDLALLKVANVPSYATTLDLGAESEIQIGADVHAIGHPTGQIWTYARADQPGPAGLPVEGGKIDAPRRCHPDADTDQSREFRRTADRRFREASRRELFQGRRRGHELRRLGEGCGKLHRFSGEPFRSPEVEPRISEVEM